METERRHKFVVASHVVPFIQSNKIEPYEIKPYEAVDSCRGHSTSTTMADVKEPDVAIVNAAVFSGCISLEGTRLLRCSA
jgi:hypothetical protein